MSVRRVPPEVYDTATPKLPTRRLLASAPGSRIVTSSNGVVHMINSGVVAPLVPDRPPVDLSDIGMPPNMLTYTAGDRKHDNVLETENNQKIMRDLLFSIRRGMYNSERRPEETDQALAERLKPQMTSKHQNALHRLAVSNKNLRDENARLQELNVRLSMMSESGRRGGGPEIKMQVQIITPDLDPAHSASGRESSKAIGTRIVSIRKGQPNPVYLVIETPSGFDLNQIDNRFVFALVANDLQTNSWMFRESLNTISKNPAVEIRPMDDPRAIMVIVKNMQGILQEMQPSGGLTESYMVHLMDIVANGTSQGGKDEVSRGSLHLFTYTNDNMFNNVSREQVQFVPFGHAHVNRELTYATVITQLDSRYGVTKDILARGRPRKIPNPEEDLARELNALLQLSYSPSALSPARFQSPGMIGLEDSANRPGHSMASSSNDPRVSSDEAHQGMGDF